MRNQHLQFKSCTQLQWLCCSWKEGLLPHLHVARNLLDFCTPALIAHPQGDQNKPYCGCRAPLLDRHVAVDVGRHVFPALNSVEAALAVTCGLLAWRYGLTDAAHLAIPGLMAALVAAQVWAGVAGVVAWAWSFCVGDGDWVLETIVCKACPSRPQTLLWG